MKSFLFRIKSLILLLIVFFSACKKDREEEMINLPVVETLSVSNINVVYALSGGNITNEGGAPVTACGVCWSDEHYPDIEDSKTTDSTVTGSFTSAITGLNHNTIYYLRAYATNKGGTGYGNELLPIFRTGKIKV